MSLRTLAAGEGSPRRVRHPANDEHPLQQNVDLYSMLQKQKERVKAKATKNLPAAVFIKTPEHLLQGEASARLLVDRTPENRRQPAPIAFPN